MSAASELATVVGMVAACAALGVPRSSAYRARSPAAGPVRPRPTPARALSAEERQAVLDVANSDRFVDTAPAEIVSTLLDEGTYLCSPRTMYRILDDAAEVRERRNQLRHPVYKKPELLATGPNDVWTWDITKLLTPRKWEYLYLYVILDVYSRYVVGWLISDKENAELAKLLIAETCAKEGVQPGQLTIHGDRGAPMTSKTLAQLMADLTITKSHSRPQVSNDNPFSESHFKTMKYRHDFPGRFEDIAAGRVHFRSFFDWYNNHHRHSGIAFMTPSSVHHGQSDAIRAARQSVLSNAYQAHPERFVRHPPLAAAPPAEVWINPPKPEPACSDTQPDGKLGCEVVPPNPCTMTSAEPQVNLQDTPAATPANDGGRPSLTSAASVTVDDVASPSDNGMSSSLASNPRSTAVSERSCHDLAVVVTGDTAEAARLQGPLAVVGADHGRAGSSRDPSSVARRGSSPSRQSPPLSAQPDDHSTIRCDNPTRESEEEVLL
jgi:putative transposase